MSRPADDDWDRRRRGRRGDQGRGGTRFAPAPAPGRARPHFEAARAVEATGGQSRSIRAAIVVAACRTPLAGTAMASRRFCAIGDRPCRGGRGWRAKGAPASTHAAAQSVTGGGRAFFGPRKKYRARYGNAGGAQKIQRACDLRALTGSPRRPRKEITRKQPKITPDYFGGMRRHHHPARNAGHRCDQRGCRKCGDQLRAINSSMGVYGITCTRSHVPKHQNTKRPLPQPAHPVFQSISDGMGGVFGREPVHTARGCAPSPSRCSQGTGPASAPRF